MIAVFGSLTTTPRNTVIVVGLEAVLTCQTNLATPVSWQFTDVVDGYKPPVYSNSRMTDKYIARNMSLVDGYNLHFRSVHFNDAGAYTCQDDDGRGEARAAWLTVLGECSQEYRLDNELLIPKAQLESMCHSDESDQSFEMSLLAIHLLFPLAHVRSVFNCFLFYTTIQRKSIPTQSL